MNYLEIEKVVGREILDSRGNPTVEAEVALPRTLSQQGRFFLILSVQSKRLGTS